LLGSRRCRSTTSSTSASWAATHPVIRISPRVRRGDDDRSARQGIATSVGMAMAQKFLAARYNQPTFTVFDYDI
jgi:transketolase